VRFDIPGVLQKKFWGYLFGQAAERLGRRTCFLSHAMARFPGERAKGKNDIKA
jgi:hypothetical protein